MAVLVPQNERAVFKARHFSNKRVGLGGILFGLKSEHSLGGKGHALSHGGR